MVMASSWTIVRETQITTYTRSTVSDYSTEKLGIDERETRAGDKMSTPTSFFELWSWGRPELGSR
jgi:hypothetical protein